MRLTTFLSRIQRFVLAAAAVAIVPTLFAGDPEMLRVRLNAPSVTPANGNDNPFGSEYGVWSARWWQWIFSIPVHDRFGVEVHPLLATGNVDCSIGQAGQVWFLAGNLTGGSTTRNCTVPRDKSLLIPILNSWCDNTGYNAPGSLPLSALRKCAADVLFAPSPGGPNQLLKTLFVQVDDQSLHISNANRGAASFQYILPNRDNLLQYFGAQVPGPGWPYGNTPVGTVVAPVAADGYWSILKPLAPGNHTICFGGTTASGFSLHITYNLTVN